ncbi:DUF550 domain-containing protein [Escherichia coli]|nr:DUF550 domain-containing protein [Escherichia coli]EMD5152086.1 DUF550 domain-containing protein [Escherichia coli]
MITITKERLLTIKQWRETYGPGSNVVLPAEEAEELARIALASLEAKPIGAFHIAEQQVDGTSDYIKDGEWPIDNGTIEVYAAPPVPVVPEEKPMPNPLKMYAVDAVAAIAEVRGWNACRAAMLQGVEPASNHEELSEENGSSLQLRNLIRQRHAEWSDKTFGCVGPVGPLKHLSKEALEAAAEPDDLSEWADMQFLLWDAQRRAGISDAEITAAMEDKLKINMERQWPEPKDGEPRLHIKEPGNSPVTPDGWISCSERMPDDGQHVIILCDGAFVLYAQYRDGEFFDVVRNGEELFETQSRNVTHWMPLPEPPQEVK